MFFFINKAHDTGKETFTIALGISQVFDQAWHKKLLPELPTSSRASASGSKAFSQTVELGYG